MALLAIGNLGHAAVDDAGFRGPDGIERRRYHTGRNYNTRPRWYMLQRHEPPDRSSPSLGRNSARKSHRNALAQDRDGRARDDCADLSEARLHRAQSLARERADDLH